MMVAAQVCPEEWAVADIIVGHRWWMALIAAVVTFIIAVGTITTEDTDGVSGAVDNNIMDVEEQQNDPLVMMEEGTPITTEDTAAAEKPKKSQHSICHEDWEAGRVVEFHVDLERINSDDMVQLSVVVVKGNKIVEEKDWFVKPPDDAEWDEEACKVHGYTKDDARVVNAQPIEVVWKIFVAYLEGHLEEGRKVGMILGWNGNSCEMTQFFKICEVKYKGELEMPRWVEYFCDPMFCIKNYKRCPLHESRRESKTLGYGLGVVYREVYDRELDGMHNSAVDSRGQAELCCHEKLRPFLDKTKSVKSIDEVWTGKRARQAAVEEEPNRQVPIGWEDCPNTSYPIPRHLKYDGYQGGGVVGPSGAVSDACSSRDLADLFTFFFTIDILENMSREMNRYGNETSVREVTKEEWRVHTSNAGINDAIDDDVAVVGDEEEEADEENIVGVQRVLFDDEDEGEYDSGDDSDFEPTEDESDDEDIYDDVSRRPKKRRYLVECDPNHPDARKRSWKGGEWIEVTPGMLLVFFGIMIISIGALKLRYWNIPWMEKRGINRPFIQNMMTHDAFQQCKRFLHFVNNKDLHKKGHKDWRPLQKIQPFIDSLLERFRKAYNMGQYISLDESMIKYKGKQVTFVQYMPAKPIKHGIKVFAICCGESGYIYGFYVYTGKENDPNGSPKKVLRRLLDQDPDFLTNSSGRVVFMDNYYTSEDVMEMLFRDYNMFTVGTVKLSDKKSRTIFDFAFHKLSNAAKKMAGRGWLRYAQKVHETLKYIIQATTWMDTKQVAILHNIHVGGPDDCTTHRYDRESRTRKEFPCHWIIPFYVRFMRGVDMIDRSMADWNVSLKSSCYYFRIFWYAFTAACANMRVIVRIIVEQSKNKADPWAKYVKGNGYGWFDWMLDMGHALAEKGIRMDWSDINDDSKRPKWMRRRFLPCSCKICFFCKNNLTGRYGPPVKPPPIPSNRSNTVTPAKRASTATVSTTKKIKRGGSMVEVEVAHDHIDPLERLHANSRDCCVCIEEGRKRKKTGEERSAIHHINRATYGCPHLSCRMFAVCKEHLSEYKHR